MNRQTIFTRITFLSLLSVLSILTLPAQTNRSAESGTTPVGQNNDPNQKAVGDIPYEMKGRTEAREPLLTFDDCTQWQTRTENAEATLYRTQEQRVVGSYSGKVEYKTTQAKAGFRVELIQPLRFEKEWNCINFWNYGNHWLWENSGEAMTHYAVIRDANDREITIPFMQEWLWRNMNYKYWFLNHIKLNDSIPRPITFVGMEFRGEGTVPNQVNQIYLGPVYGYEEVLKPLAFKPFPDKLPFPLRKETILPTNKTTDFVNRVEKDGTSYLFTYQAQDATISYRVDPHQPIGGVTLLSGGQNKAINAGAEIVFENHEAVKWSLMKQTLTDNLLTLQYKVAAKKFTQYFDCTYAINQKSLIWTIEEKSATGRVEEIRLGSTGKITDGKLVDIPFMVYNPFANDSYTADRPSLLYADNLFYLTMFDWYYTNASRYDGGQKGIKDGQAVYNGGVKYYPLNNKKRNPVRERLFINVSPDVHEVFPTIDNPKSPMRSNQADRLWATAGGSDLVKLGNYVSELRSKGVEMVSIRYHEDFWRAGGESYTFRTEPNPELGVQKIKDYVRFVQDHDWRVGTYTNYMDLAPVNALWNEDWVRISHKDGGWGPAWCRCYAPKVSIGWEQQALLAPQIHQQFGTNFSYCDVETCISPMDRVDYDYRAPGAGKFRSVIEYVGMTLLNERRAYQGPVYSEGGVHMFYAGLCDGNYSWIDAGLPIFPDFQLLKINPLEMDALANASGYAYLAYAYAFGNIGQLSEGTDAIRRYAFLQPFQSSYSMVPVTEIAYYDGQSYVSSSEAVKRDLIKAPQLRVTYQGGLQLYSNFSDQAWQVTAQNTVYTLPRHGVLAIHPEKNLFAVSATNPQVASQPRLDKVYSDGLCFIDTYGESVEGNLGGQGCYLLKKEKFGWEIIPVDTTKVIDFDLSLIGLSDFGVDIEAVDEAGNVLARITDQPAIGRICFYHQPAYYKYRVCPVVSVQETQKRTALTDIILPKEKISDCSSGK